MNPSLDFQFFFFFFVFFTSELIICNLFYAPGGKLNVQYFNMNSSVTWNHRSVITASWLSRKSKNPLSVQMNLWLVLPPYLSERNVTKPVDVTQKTQRRRINVVPTLNSDVGMTSWYSCNGHVDTTSKHVVPTSHRDVETTLYQRHNNHKRRW